MAATLFFPPPSMPTANPDHLPNEILEDDHDVDDETALMHHHNRNSTDDDIMHHHHNSRNDTDDDDDDIMHHHHENRNATDDDDIMHHHRGNRNTTDDDAIMHHHHNNNTAADDDDIMHHHHSNRNATDDDIMHHHHVNRNATDDDLMHHHHSNNNATDDDAMMHHHNGDPTDGTTIIRHLHHPNSPVEDSQPNDDEPPIIAVPGVEANAIPEGETVQEEHNHEVPDEPPSEGAIEAPPGGSGIDIGTLIGRRVTLKPRRTLSLSPTPARTGDMMARNLRAARWLDFTNEDDDDGLYQPSSDSESEGKRKTIKEEMLVGRVRMPTRRGGSLGSLTVGAMTGLGREVFSSRRASSSMKRPLEVTLPCQEIQYLDISYQKVGIHAVQFSPIPRKKIAYHPVPYHAIHYCDVPYLGERPVKRKPPA